MVFYNNELNHNSLAYPSNKYKNILFIDNNVKDLQIFSSSVNECTFPIIYSSKSTKTELLELLKKTFRSIERIGIVFASNLGTNNTFLDCKPFFINNEISTSYSENLKFILSIIKDFKVKNIDYLACNTLNYSNWTNYYDIITKETGVIVGASNDKTGNIKYGGNWIMESTMQNIEFVYFTKSIKYYNYLLDNPQFEIWVEEGLSEPLEPVINGKYMYVPNRNYSAEDFRYISKINLENPTDNIVWISEIPFLTAIATKGDYIYYSNIDGAIYRVPLNNPSNIQDFVLEGEGLNTPVYLLIHKSYMYAVNYGNNTISKIDLESGTMIKEDWSEDLDEPFDIPVGLVVNNTFMYLVNAGDGSISKIDLESGNVIERNWAIGLNTPTTIAIYEEYMYALDPKQDFPNEGIIWQISLKTGLPVKWATGLHSPIGIVIQDNIMYVTNIANNTIVRYEFPKPPISNICFPAGTPINTDQGIIAIEMINPNIHTIGRKPIVDITKTITPEKYLIEFKKNALGFNYPTKNTIMSKEHKVYHQGKMREAKTFLEKFERVVKVKYNGEILYNVLMEEYSQMLVNNLICETLHPDNIIAKLYTKKCKYTNDVRNKIYVVLIECLEKKDYKNYTKIMKRYCE